MSAGISPAVDPPRHPLRAYGSPAPRGHPELEAHEEAVLRAVEAPTETAPGREPGEEWFYLADAGPSRWLKVVVVFDSRSSDRIITAFPRRRKP